MLNSSINKNKVGRNQPCPCGSGKKYKMCCDNNNTKLDYWNKGNSNNNGSSRFNRTKNIIPKITQNFGGEYVDRLPSDYEKPKGYLDDLGLLLWERGVKEHRIYFQMNKPVMGMDIGQMNFPTTYNINPYDYVNTSFCPIDSQVVGMEEGGMFYWTTQFGFFLGNQMMWLKQSHPNIEEVSQSLIMSIIFPKGRPELKQFCQSIWDNGGGYGKFKVSPLIKKRNPMNNSLEFFSVLIFDGYDTTKDTNGFDSSMFNDEFEKNFDFVGVKEKMEEKMN